jgi:hypothetical protein
LYGEGVKIVYLGMEGMKRVWEFSSRNEGVFKKGIP